MVLHLYSYSDYYWIIDGILGVIDVRIVWIIEIHEVGVLVSHMGVVILGLEFACVIETLVGVVGLTELERGTMFGCRDVDGGISNYRGVGPSGC